ncbi:MAG: lysophospholipid acyltransferase family protein, partial [Steroidobacteraceae bacterium]
MLRAVSSDTGPQPAAGALKPGRPVWWVRLVSRVPMMLLNRFADLVGWLAFRVFPYREHIVRENLTRAFPELDETGLRKVMRDYYDGFAQMFVELLKGATLPAAEITRRVRILNLDKVREQLAGGQSVLLVAAHQCN